MRLDRFGHLQLDLSGNPRVLRRKPLRGLRRGPGSGPGHPGRDSLPPDKDLRRGDHQVLILLQLESSMFIYCCYQVPSKFLFLLIPALISAILLKDGVVRTSYCRQFLTLLPFTAM